MITKLNYLELIEKLNIKLNSIELLWSELRSMVSNNIKSLILLALNKQNLKFLELFNINYFAAIDFKLKFNILLLGLDPSNLTLDYFKFILSRKIEDYGKISVTRIPV